MNSLWEANSYLTHDLIIIGGGLVGLSTACSVLEKHPEQRVILLEKGVIPTGASTKNAALIQTNSYSGFVRDVQRMGAEQAIEVYNFRWQGLLKHKKRLTSEQMDQKFNGSYELITDDEMLPYATQAEIDKVNALLYPHYQKNIFSLENSRISEFGFNPQFCKALIYNQQESQIDSGKTNRSLYQYAIKLGALYLTGANVIKYERSPEGMQVFVENTYDKDKPLRFTAKNIVFAINAYIRNFFPDLDVYPLRGQIILTKPIPNLKIRGVFSYNYVVYYFRDYYGRILLGGGETIDLEGERSLKIEGNKKIQDELIRHLKEYIIPGVPFEIERMWSGLMAFTNDRVNQMPICKEQEPNVYVTGRCSGIGVSMSPYLGERIEEMIYQGKKGTTTLTRQSKL